MKNKILTLLLLVPSLTACQVISSLWSRKGSEDILTNITIGNFHITNVYYISTYQNNIRVTYTGDIDPFNAEGHLFDRLEINGNKSNWISPQHDQHYFDCYAPKKNLTSFLFDFYDEQEEIYISLNYDNNSGQVDISVSGDTTGSSSDESHFYPDGYSSLLWSDEFNDDIIDENKWDYDIGTGGWGWGNGEMQYYRKENATIANGALHITAKKEDFASSHYTSSRLVTRGKFSFKYGYIEARIKLPIEQAMWPAFWMLPETNTYGGWPYSGEIDIMEAKGRIPNQSSSALHYATLDGNHTYKSHEVNGHNINEYHLYACEWQESYIKYYVDGAIHMTVRNDAWTTSASPDNINAPFDAPFHLIFNLAVGGIFDNWVEPSSSFVSAEMVVDYVRVFQ